MTGGNTNNYATADLQSYPPKLTNAENQQRQNQQIATTHASAGNRTRATSMATMYSTTRPLMLAKKRTPYPQSDPANHHHPLRTQEQTHIENSWQTAHDCPRTRKSKAGAAPFLRCRGHCIPLWAVVQPLQVVLSSACSVDSLSRRPVHYLQGHPHLRVDAIADCPFGRGNQSTWRAGRTTLHDTPSAKPPVGAQRIMTVSRYQLQRQRAKQPTRTNARSEPTEPLQTRMEATRQKDACCARPVAK